MCGSPALRASLSLARGSPSFVRESWANVEVLVFKHHQKEALIYTRVKKTIINEVRPEKRSARLPFAVTLEEVASAMRGTCP